MKFILGVKPKGNQYLFKQFDDGMAVMRAGRARWKIENETFNTLKNQGYHFDT